MDKIIGAIDLAFGRDRRRRFYVRYVDYVTFPSGMLHAATAETIAEAKAMLRRILADGGSDGVIIDTKSGRRLKL